MTYTLRLLTAASRDLVVEALRAEAGKRTRVAQGAALALADDRAARKDVRAASVRVTDLLAEAGRLDQLADELAAAQDLPVVAGPVPPLAVAQPAHAVTLPLVDSDDVDDGLSEAAHAAMRLAEDYEAELVDPEAPDVETGATVEDDEPVTDDDPAKPARDAADRAAIDGALG